MSIYTKTNIAQSCIEHEFMIEVENIAEHEFIMEEESTKETNKNQYS